MRKRIYYNQEQRDYIWDRYRKGDSLHDIARAFNRYHSSIQGILIKSGGIQPPRRKRADIALSLLEREEISRGLALQLSFRQIAGRLKRMFPDNQDFYVSHETIYKTLYIQTRGALKKELQKCLRSKRVMRRSKHSTIKDKGHGEITGAIPISERPPSVEDRAIPGHWEGDLIEGKLGTYIATLVERHSRYVMLAKVNSKKTNEVIGALIKQSKKLPKELYKSLTWDRGSELSNHARFTLATDIKVYFCDPSSPWQRGSNENTNRLLREYFPKGTDLTQHSQGKLSAIARQLNERPRKTLQYQTPAEVFNKCVAAID